ncbi:hypothetical protein [Nocardioides sp. GXZ039]|uniref:hypothetical protein n=1 Tax=Nocardioides sp. GXZ039 TaxID=3136018 RepID=UPI0030F3B959
MTTMRITVDLNLDDTMGEAGLDALIVDAITALHVVRTRHSAALIQAVVSSSTSIEEDV